MSLQKYQELKQNLELRNKLLSIGIGCPMVGPTGPKGNKGDKGDKGDPGSSAVSSSEALLFASFNEANNSEKMVVNDWWLIPSDSTYFTLTPENDIEVQPGIYQITISGLIKGVDNNHAAVFYLQNDEGDAIKDLTFELLAGNLSQMSFSQTILFRFEKLTILQLMASISGEELSSNVTISDVNLLMKKVHE